MPCIGLSRLERGMIMDTITHDVKTNPPSPRTSDWLGPPLRTLRQPAFETACAELMHEVEVSFTPSLLVGIRTGGLVVAESMARAAPFHLPVFPVTSRRITTGAKSRLPLFRKLLAVLPRPTLDLMRRIEHRWLITPRVRRAPRQWADRAEAEAVAVALAECPCPPRVLVVDDAIDSGVTLLTVLELLRQVCPPGTEIRSAVITQTLMNPIVRPDHVLFQCTLCRFPWSFDAED
jgi:uncharacterized protein